MLVEDTQLHKFILDSGLVSKEDLEQARLEAAKSGQSVGDTLISDGKITPDNLRRIQALVLGISFIDLKDKKIPFEILSIIPEPIARSHSIVAVSETDSTLEVAMLDVSDLSAIDAIKKKIGLRILPRITDSESMKYALIQYQKGLRAEFGDIIQKEIGSLGQADEGPAAARIVDALLKHALAQNASDVHMDPAEDHILVRYRIDGILHDAIVLPKQAGPAVSLRIKMLSGLKIDERFPPQDGRFKANMDGDAVSLRVSILPTYYGEKIVMRLLREDASGFTLEHLGLHGEALDCVHRALTRESGMIIVAGPVGSGRTTTLYTMLDILNAPQANIATVEDPIEHRLTRVNQTNVRPDIGLGFAEGVRSVLHQDPDVIMVGEIRDDQTAAAALGAVSSGRLVISAVRIGSAASAVRRLLDMKAEPSVLASSLDMVIGQRLVRGLSETKAPYHPSKDELAKLSKSADLDKVLKALKEEKIIKPTDSWDTVMFYNPVAISGDDGFRGRVGLNEVMKMSRGVRDLIAKKASTDEIEAQARKEGMLTILEDGIFKCAQGLTALDEVLRALS